MKDLRGRHFLDALDFAPAELRPVVDLALRMKRQEVKGSLPGCVLGMLFFNPSVRTRVSCEAAMARLGGHAIALHPGKDTWSFEERDGVVMDGATQEHVRELAPVLCRMVDVVGIRRSERITTGAGPAAGGAGWSELKRDSFLHAFARHATRPVLNLESNTAHPLQGLADMATLLEKLKEPRGRKYVLTWADHPKPLPVATPHSQLVAAADLGMEVTLLRPEGYDLDPAVIAAARARAEAQGGSLVVTDDPDAAYRGAVAVCAKSWGSLEDDGDVAADARRRAALRPRWTVDETKLARTDDAIFLHCLPVRRNVVVTDAVLDGPRSVVVDQAENRLWTVAALLQCLVAG